MYKYVIRCGSKNTAIVLYWLSPQKEDNTENRNNWSELIWAEQSRRLSVASMSRHSALRDDLRPLNSRPLSTALSPSLSRSVTSTPVRLTLLNKASSKITPSCLSALLRYKSFIKHKGESRSISNHQHWKEICVCVCVFVLLYHVSDCTVDIALLAK